MTSDMLSVEERKTLLSIAREAIRHELSATKMQPDPPSHPELLSKRGVFVTLTQDGQLRGCIGRVEPQEPLFKGVAEMAKAAAFGDPRFPPLTLSELSKTMIEISVLSPLERVKRIDSLNVGRQGLLVRRGVFSGLLLPQVAAAHGWSIEEFLCETCTKASLPLGAWREEGTEIFSFTAEIFSEENV